MKKYDAIIIGFGKGGKTLATGRRPNTEGLNLQAAGVKLTERGAI